MIITEAKQNVLKIVQMDVDIYYKSVLLCAPSPLDNSFVLNNYVQLLKKSEIVPGDSCGYRVQNSLPPQGQDIM